MNGSVRNIIAKTFAITMVAIMVLFVVNKAVYVHAHKLTDGTIVTHAHPFNKSTDSNPFKSHKHSKSDLHFLNNLEIFFLTVLVSFFALFFYNRKKIKVQEAVLYSHNYFFRYNGRAPPEL